MGVLKTGLICVFAASIGTMPPVIVADLHNGELDGKANNKSLFEEYLYSATTVAISGAAGAVGHFIGAREAAGNVANSNTPT